MQCPKCGSKAKKRKTVIAKGRRKGMTRITVYCSECTSRSYRKRKLYLRAWHRNKKYGVTEEETLKLWDGQKGKCPICGERLKVQHHKGRLNYHVDHDHKTGKVRGLLCFHCNTGLGNFKDSLVLLKSAARYLRKCSRQD